MINQEMVALGCITLSTTVTPTATLQMRSAENALKLREPKKFSRHRIFPIWEQGVSLMIDSARIFLAVYAVAELLDGKSASLPLMGYLTIGLLQSVAVINSVNDWVNAK